MEVKELLKICDEFSWLPNAERLALIKLAEGHRAKITTTMKTFIDRLAFDDIPGVEAMLENGEG